MAWYRGKVETLDAKYNQGHIKLPEAVRGHATTIDGEI